MGGEDVWMELAWGLGRLHRGCEAPFVMDRAGMKGRGIALGLGASFPSVTTFLYRTPRNLRIPTSPSAF